MKTVDILENDVGAVERPPTPQVVIIEVYSWGEQLRRPPWS